MIHCYVQNHKTRPEDDCISGVVEQVSDVWEVEVVHGLESGTWVRTAGIPRGEILASDGAFFDRTDVAAVVVDSRTSSRISCKAFKRAKLVDSCSADAAQPSPL